jgi:hypothetical protein
VSAGSLEEADRSEPSSVSSSPAPAQKHSVCPSARGLSPK